MEAQTTNNTVSTGTTETNIPVNTKIEGQPRPKVDKEKLAAIKELKDAKIKTNQIIQK
jgi:hypothetical protein